MHCHTLPAGKSFFDAAGDGCLEKMAQQLTLAETAMTILGEGRMVRNTIIQIKTAKPAIGQVQMHFFTKPPLGSDTKALAHQKHADQQLRVDRWTPGVAVVIRRMLLRSTKRSIDRSRRSWGT